MRKPAISSRLPVTLPISRLRQCGPRMLSWQGHSSNPMARKKRRVAMKPMIIPPTRLLNIAAIWKLTTLSTSACHFIVLKSSCDFTSYLRQHTHTWNKQYFLPKCQKFFWQLKCFDLPKSFYVYEDFIQGVYDSSLCLEKILPKSELQRSVLSPVRTRGLQGLNFLNWILWYYFTW